MIYMALLHLKRLVIQSKRGLLLTILMPTAVVCLVAFLLGGVKSEVSISIGVVNNDSGLEGNGLCERLEKENFEVHRIASEDAKIKIKKNIEEIVLIIPRDFTESIRDSKKPSVEILKAASGNMDSSVVNQINAYIEKRMVLYRTSSEIIKAGIAIDKSKFDRDMKSDFNKEYVTVSSENVSNSTLRSVAGTVSTNLIVSFLMYSMMYIVIDLYSLKKEKILLRSLSTPNTNSKIAGSIFLAMFMLLFMQSLTLIIITKFVFNMYWGKSLFAVMLVFLTLDLVVLGAGLVAARWAKSEDQIAPVVSIVVTLTCALGGSFMPLDQIPNLPAIIKKISYFTPQNWAISALNDITIRNVGVYNIIPKLLILILFAGVFFAAGAIQFRETAK